MRYALRRQLRIKQVLGEDYLKLLRGSLDSMFPTEGSVEQHDYDGEPYKVIHVPSAADGSEVCFEFYVVSTVFDVMILSYKSSFG